MKVAQALNGSLLDFSTKERIPVCCVGSVNPVLYIYLKTGCLKLSSCSWQSTSGGQFVSPA